MCIDVDREKGPCMLLMGWRWWEMRGKDHSNLSLGRWWWHPPQVCSDNIGISENAHNAIHQRELFAGTA